MSRIMFIDGTHREQIRVAVTEKGRVTDFDIESFDKKQTIGNIYLAKVTRIEPSLQAAFVEYGAGRQGFLSFSEIHPDYYQIPVEDRQSLIEEAARLYNNSEDKEFEQGLVEDTPINVSQETDHVNIAYQIDKNDEVVSEKIAINSDEDTDLESESESESELNTVSGTDSGIALENDAKLFHQPQNTDAEHTQNQGHLTMNDFESDNVSEGISEIEAEDTSKSDKKSFKNNQKKSNFSKYKIQEVIKKRQILLVQVLKSERGNKGAALTSYLSLAGRYCVLMPNTACGGGISRKITDLNDRRKLRSIIKDLELPESMGLIIRTAGLQRTKADLRRDYEYLLRLWDSVRQLTMSSIAPALVYEEGNLIKRALRDVYTRETSKIMIQGEEAYKQAKQIMKMIMPSASRSIHHYRDPLPLFSRYQIERQLDELSHFEVTLKSGGYLVINHTEALIAIDINSGKSTNAYSVEETAYKTNLEAAEEIARQLRLRDLAGLIVIDFIDMDNHNHVKAVERKMRECLKNDKARLQVTGLSIFGLMEMTRQRLRPAMKDLISVPCEHCQGVGFVQSLEMSALRVLRVVFEEIAHKKLSYLQLACSINIAHYLLNKKRAELFKIEKEYDLTIDIVGASKYVGIEYELETQVKSNETSNAVSDTYQEPVSDTMIRDDTYSQGSPEEDSKVSSLKSHKRRQNHKNASSDENISDEKEDCAKNEQNKKSRGYKKRSRFDRYPKTTELYTTQSGNQVIIENPVSVKNISATATETSYEGNNQDIALMHDNSEIVHDNVIIETHKTVQNSASHKWLDNKPLIQDDNVIIADHYAIEKQPVQKKVMQENARENLLCSANTSVLEKPEVTQEVQISYNNENRDAHQPQVVDLQQVQNEQLDPETPDKADDKTEVQKPARRGWWRSRFGL